MIITEESDEKSEEELEYGMENAFIKEDVIEKYIRLCDELAYEMVMKHPRIPLKTVNEIVTRAFALGNEMTVEVFDQESLKESYL